MRWLGAVGLVTMMACGGEERPTSTAEQAPQQLVIPAMDAGAPPTPMSAPVATQAPPPAEPKLKPNEIAERDKRLARMSVRSPATVDSMIQGLEKSIATLPPTDPSLTLILRQIADLYEESASLSQDETSAKAARTKEAEHLGTLIKNFPAFSLLDEARYYRGLTFERLGDLRNARTAYFDLIKSSPQSKYIPAAYFAFGELFFDEAKSDPSKWDLAKQAFMQTLKYPPRNNTLFPFALLRMGQIADVQGDAATATSNFDRLRHDFPASDAVKRIPTGR